MIAEELSQVRGLMTDTVATSSLRPLFELVSPNLEGGKMLRSRLLLQLARATDVARDDRLRAAAAVELVHAASLLHDDVIDGGKVRRGQPSLWVAKGVKGAILLGDFLVCQAFSMLQATGNGLLVDVLTESAKEMCEAEAEQELLLKDRPPNWETCVGIARRKTGSLFAFSAYASAGSSAPLATALRAAGYALGTAYQLADDVYDAYADPLLADKSVGRDAANEQLTAVSATTNGADPVLHIRELCESARSSLAEWPGVQRAWDAYMAQNMAPALDAFLEPVRAEAVS